MVFLLSCGGKGSNSSKTEADLIPQKPIVFTAPVFIGGSEIAPPWFSFRLSITNTSPEPLTIVGLELEAYSLTGEKFTTAFSPAEEDYANDTVDCKFVSFGTWASQESKELGLEGSCTATSILFFVSGLPQSGSNSFRYRIKIKPIGWFGSFNNPQSRYERTFTFTTE